jgi:hypothetical protein
MWSENKSKMVMEAQTVSASVQEQVLVVPSQMGIVQSLQRNLNKTTLLLHIIIMMYVFTAINSLTYKLYRFVVFLNLGVSSDT